MFSPIHQSQVLVLFMHRIAQKDKMILDWWEIMIHRVEAIQSRLHGVTWTWTPADCSRSFISAGGG